MKTALIAGATGLVGRHCLNLLLATDAYDRVISIGRRPPAISHPRLEHHVVDFDHLDPSQPVLSSDDVFCCLGTTIKVAGTKEKFRAVDYGYPLQLARLTFDAGARQYLLVTSMGADSRSMFFYNRVKGDLENDVRSIPFESCSFFRPSLLLGERAAHRPGEKAAEKMMSVFSFVFNGPLEKYRPIRAETVAAAMVVTALQKPPGIHVYESNEIQRIGS